MTGGEIGKQGGREREGMRKRIGEAGSRGRWIVGMALIVVGGVAAIWTWNRTEEPAPGVAAREEVAPTPTPEVSAAVEVTSAVAITRQRPRGLEVVGSLAADEEVVIGAQVPGELTALRVDFGSFVTAGQEIAQIDQRDARLRIEQAEAGLRQTMARLGMKEGDSFEAKQNAEVKVAQGALDLATMELDRAAQLIEKGDISRSMYDQARINHGLSQARYQAAVDAVNQQLAVLEQQRSALALAKKALTDTVVRAPITGAVKEKFVAKGTYLPVGGRIVSLVRLNPLRLRADIPEHAAAKVRVGQSMRLRVEAHPGEVFTGRVVRIGATLNEQTRSLTVEAEVANPRTLLRPGMFARADLTTMEAAPVVMVPRTGVTTMAGLSKVFLLIDGKAVEKVVRTGAIEGEMVEIVEGVQSGQRLATSNLDRLQQGTAVRDR
jgi:membrane fusion protein (multidrug efflux system)